MTVKGRCTAGGVVRFLAVVHHGHMPEQTNSRHFLREWREFKGYSLEKVGEWIDKSHASVSRYETGLQAVTDELLERLAELYSTDPASLLMRNPLDEDGLWSIYDQLTPTQRKRATRVLRAMLDDEKTGTED